MYHNIELKGTNMTCYDCEKWNRLDESVNPRGGWIWELFCPVCGFWVNSSEHTCNEFKQK